MSGPRSLEQAQKTLWRLITWPEGVRAALRREPEAEPLAALVRSDDRLCAEDRLDVYANAYFYRILDVLREDFPALARILGEDTWNDLVTSYLAIHPSEHFSLRYIGDRLSGFLRENDAVASIRGRWPFAADLAALEWAMGEVFDAADARPATREALIGVPPERWSELELALGPAVRLLRLDWPVHVLQRAARGEETEPLPPIEARRTALCVWRSSERVYHRALEAAEDEALRSLQTTCTFGALCEQAAALVGDDDAARVSASWLARWIDDGLLRQITTR